MFNFIKNLSITKVLILSLALVVIFILASTLLMVDQRTKTAPIEPHILANFQQHAILTADENLVVFKVLSRFDTHNCLAITNQRLLILNNWHVQSISLTEIIAVTVMNTPLGFSIVMVQTKNNFFEAQIEKQSLDAVIGALQVDPKIVTYTNNITK